MQGLKRKSADGQSQHFGRNCFEPLERRRLLSISAVSASVSIPNQYAGAIQDPAGSGNYATGHGGHTVSWIVIHTTEENAASTIKEFTTPNLQVSANYMVERDGVIDQFVSNNNTAYHCGNLAYNESAIGIEHERYDSNGVSYNATEQEYEASANLVRWLSSYYNIPLVHLATSVAPASPSSGSAIIGHYQVPDPTNPKLGGGIDHHTDPVNWDWTHYMDLITSTTTPLMPVLIGPGTISGGTLTSTSTTFSWMPVEYATSYQVVVKDTTSGASNTYTVNGSSSSLALNLNNHDSYTWFATSFIGTTQSIASPTYSFMINAPTVSSGPYGGTAFIPGQIVQAENYDLGGEGVAYHDTDAANLGGQYRVSDAVDIESTTDTGGGYDVGWTHAGEYLNYTGSFASAGNYTFAARVADVGAGGTFHVNVDGVNATGTMTIPDTGGFQNYVTITSPSFAVSAGTHVFQIVFDGQTGYGFSGNVNWFSVQTPSVSSGESPYGGAPTSLPGTIQAENYDLGGEGVAYHDTDSANLGGQYRNDGVDIESVPGGGYAVDYTHAGEWLKYTVNVTTAGAYTLDAKLANYGDGAAFHIEVDGANVTGSLAVPNTRYFTTYQDVLKSGIVLSAGQHVIRFVWDANSQYGYAGNLDSFSFS